MFKRINVGTTHLLSKKRTLASVCVTFMHNHRPLKVGSVVFSLITLVF